MTTTHVNLLFWLGLLIALVPLWPWFRGLRTTKSDSKRVSSVIPDDAFTELAKKLPWVSALGLILIAYSITLCTLMNNCLSH
jgi:hypothetical protein